MRFLAILLALLGTQLCAQNSALVTLETRNDSRGWEGVGRLDITGKGFCTASLIQSKLILTAAHCLFETDGTAISPDRFIFEAGLRDGRAEASRGITRILAHPDYDHSGPSTDTSEVAHDIAILELDQPIRNGRILPYAIAAKPQTGDQIGVVSYGRDRANAASLQEVCEVTGRQSGVILMSCDIAFGSSGAPVFIMQDGAPKIVSVVSAMADVDGQQISIGTSLQEPLAALLAMFKTASTGTGRKIVTGGQRTETGAKFVRP
ncbi:trypsin-like serine peptidase [Yoonia sp. MH D7]